MDNVDIVICVSRHGDAAQNEPYDQAAGGEVAATNRPILQPTVASIGLSAISNLHTFKIGFGYSTKSWYADPNSLSDPVFPLTLTDPQIVPFPSNDPQFVSVLARPDQPGVRRVNDIDVSGEQYSPFDADTAEHGQVQVFRKAGDPYSFCVASGQLRWQPGRRPPAGVRRAGRPADDVGAQGVAGPRALQAFGVLQRGRLPCLVQVLAGRLRGHPQPAAVPAGSRHQPAAA